VDIDEIDLTTVATPEEPPREPRRHRAINGTLYIELMIKKEKGKQRSAWYWDHGSEYEIQNPPKGTNPWVWRYNHCKNFQCYGVNSSTHIRAHLKTHSLQEQQETSQAVSIIDRLRVHTPASVDSRPLATADRREIQSRKFEETLVAFICCVHIAFTIVENKYFVTLLTTLLNIADVFLPSSHNTARSWALKSYEKRKNRVKQLLQQTRSNIHLSFNL
jgi:hypothetical protein